MSSILKALKKVEDVQPEPRRTENWSHAFDSGETIRKQARRSRTVRTGLAALGATLVLGVGGWWAYVQGSKPGGGPEQPAGKVVTENGADGIEAPGTPAGVAPVASKPPPPRAWRRGVPRASPKGLGRRRLPVRPARPSRPGPAGRTA